ncbi:MAG: hypothetical protein ACYC35_03390 [Pirellulales bacterium]
MFGYAITSPSRAKARMPFAGRDYRLGSWNGLHPLACRTILVVEWRDEVAARLVGDLTAMGMQVERAACATEASRRYACFRADLLLVNVDLPDGSGWLLTAKLRLASAAPRIWLYAPQPLPDAVAMAEYVGADGLFAYEGDLFRLSAAVVSRVSVLPAARLVA